ncbi:MAG: permease [Chloroflexi bacterium RBG_13_56_8]|nr:MAG: permease [Chloroflexi bacterium RBG_13_56_8]
MTDIFEHAIRLLQGGLGNLAAYLAAHVLLCLLPAFFIAGGLTALVPKEAVTRFLGRNTPKFISYPAAALAGSVLAVCSCTIVPLFAGIYRKGAGLGPAITFLFYAPAANILALAYTGVAIGADFALARIVLSLAFGIGIGLIMALIFSREDVAHAEAVDSSFVGREGLKRTTVVFMLFMVALLIAGTLKVSLLLNSYVHFTLPIQGLDRFQDTLYHLVPFDAAKGEEGVSVQGVILIGLLALIALAAWKGLSKVDEGYNRWTWVSLGLVALTLVVGAMGMQPTAQGLEINLTGKFMGVILAIFGIWYIARRFFEEYEIQQWLWETWRFVRQIFPLLIVGVFAVGVVRGLIKAEWIQSIAGRNTVVANLVGVLFGVFMYFPTLVEVPIAKMFLSLGMHRGPLIAYLMADPELSLQSILITASIIGKLKAWTYVGWVALFSTLSGLIYGAWVDGANLWLLLAYVVAGLVILAIVLNRIGVRQRRELAASANIMAG